MRYDGIDGRVAIVTGANHGIGAATAVALADNGARVLLTYLRVDDGTDDGLPETYRTNRSRDASQVVRSIRDAAGRPRPSRRISATRQRRQGCSMRPRRRSGRSRCS